MAKSLGQIAYEGYIHHMKWNTVARVWPSWDELSNDQREGWHSAADEVEVRVMENISDE